MHPSSAILRRELVILLSAMAVAAQSSDAACPHVLVLGLSGLFL